MSGKKLLLAFTLVVFFVAISFSAGAGYETGNICNEGCAPDAACTGSTPYLCRKGWALDTCVAKGYDGGYCGGKTDKGGYCFECSGGCILQSELGSQCGPLTTCGPEEYCCQRVDWYQSNECKPKHSDMGCCGGPPTGGDRTTFLKATIDNNGFDACTSKVTWEVKTKGSADFLDYSTECVEGNPDIKIDRRWGSMTLTCISQKLPSATSGPHAARATWCGESKEFEYPAPKSFEIKVTQVGTIPGDIDSIPPYEIADPSPSILIADSGVRTDCRISLENKGYNDMNNYNTCKGNYGGYCLSPDTGSPGEKKVYIACMDSDGNEQRQEVPFFLLSDTLAPSIEITHSPGYGYSNAAFSINVAFIDAHSLDMASIKAHVDKGGIKIADIPLSFDSYDPILNKYAYTAEWHPVGQTGGKYDITADAGDTLGNHGTGSASVRILESNKQFKIYVAAVNYGDMAAYKVKANREMQKLKEVLPFKEAECKDSLSITILDKNCGCGSIEGNCPEETVDCIEEMGIYDYDLIMTYTDSATCNGYAISGQYPFAICYRCDGVDNVAFTCGAHEIGHTFKLCDEYESFTWQRQNQRFKSWGLLAETPPYSGCGNSYPKNTGIGKYEVCDTDCSIDATACEEKTCGVKLGGTSQPYDVGIMGGGGAWKFDNSGIVANPTEYGAEAYDFMLNKIKEAGYCNG